MQTRQRRRLVLGAAVTGVLASLRGDKIVLAKEHRDVSCCSGLSPDVRGTKQWLALRFVKQGNVNAGMLVPTLPNTRPSIDDVLRYGIFFRNYRSLAIQVSGFADSWINSIKVRGAASSIEQPERLFEDFDIVNIAVDIREHAKAEEAEILKALDDGNSGAEGAKTRLVYWRRENPRPGDNLFAFKFRGQIDGSAGFTVLGMLSEHLPSSLAESAFFFRNLDDVRRWRLQQVSVDLPGKTSLPYGEGFSNSELDGMPRWIPV